MELRSAAEVMLALERGCRISLVWRDDGPFNKLPEEVIACMGNSILVRGWSDTWIPLGGVAYRLYAHPTPLPTFKGWLDARGIELPNLGVNCPAGCDTAAANTIGQLLMDYKQDRSQNSRRDDGSRISYDVGPKQRRVSTDGSGW